MSGIFGNNMSKKPMHYLMRGNLLTREQEIIKGSRETPFTEEADELNKKHYEKKYIEKFGKTPMAGHYIPNKKYIWFNKQVQ